MSIDFYTEVRVANTPKTTALKVAGSIGVVLGKSDSASGPQYAVRLGAEVWMFDAAELTPTGQTFTREDIYGESPAGIKVRPQHYTDDDQPSAE
jgi:hypothetical protein